MSDDESIKKPLKEWLDEFYADTGKISDIVRSLALAGIGVIWIFKNSDLSKVIIPKELVSPLRFIVLCLIVDLVQYLWRAINVYILYRTKEIKYLNGKLSNKDISDVTIHVYVEIGTWLFFIIKIIFAAIAYYKIYNFLILKL